MSIHNITTKVYTTKFGFGHYVALLYDKTHYEMYELSRPMDMNGVCISLSYGVHSNGGLFVPTDVENGISFTLTDIKDQFDFGVEVSLDEYMDETNIDVRTKVKQLQENFYPFKYKGKYQKQVEESLQ